MFWNLVFKHFRAAQPVGGATFLTPQGGTACFGRCFLNALRGHSVFWKLFCEHHKAARPVLVAIF